jgi:hypothetical protein
MSDDDGWIVIPNWDRFQHYKDRDPTWIKDYVSQLDDDDWLSLSLTERGALQVLRLLYARADGKLLTSRAAEAINFRGAHVARILERLNETGLLELRASKPLALARSREKRREEKKDRASALAENPTPNGDPERVGVAVDEDMLRLARGWLTEHPSSRPADGAAIADDEWQEGDELF